MPACSAIIDTGPYLARDGSVTQDGGPDADGPTTPEVRITPASPVGTDDLTAEIVTESTDPLNAGPVTYEYRWLQGGTDAAIDAATVPASVTAKGQTWSVEVTPVSADGARRGVAGTASVTIGNTPPTIAYVGLNRYRPVMGETIAAFVGPTSDADGDPVAVRYAWFRNDTVLDGQVANRLDTSRVTLAPGDTIRVEATAHDSSVDGNTVSAGPALLLADVTRWRQLLPQRVLPRASFVAFDEGNQRVVFAYPEHEDGSGVKLWEYDLDTATGGRFVQLFPTGPEPALMFATAIYDSTHRRVLLFGAQRDIDSGSLTSDVYVLDVAQRGRESWSVIEGGSAPPPPRFLPAVAYDEEREQVLMYGGIDFLAGSVRDDAWLLDVSTPGGEAWSELAVPLPTDPLIGPALAIDAAHDRAVLAGGAALGSGGGDGLPSLAIYTLDLTSTSAGFVVAPNTLPREVLLPTVGVDQARGRMLLALGVGTGDTFYSDAIAIDLDSLIPSLVTPTGEGPSAGGRGFLARRSDGTLVLYGGVPFIDAAAPFDLYGWDPSTDALTPIHRTGIDLPPPLEGALASGVLTLFGGTDHRRTVRDEVWRMGGEGWTRVTTAADPLSGGTPGPRAGQILQANSAYGADLQFFGGDTGTGALGSGAMWVLRDATWIQQTLATGSPPAPRQGAMFFVPACGGWRTGYYGGVDGSGNYLDDTGFLDCVSTDRECTWTDPVSPAVRAPARAFAAAARLDDDTRVVMFGGEGPFGVLGDVWSLYTCGGGPQAWTMPSVTSASGVTPPAPRSRHTMTLTTSGTGGALPSLIVVGGSSTAGGGSPLADAVQLVQLSMSSYQWRDLGIASGPEDEHLSERYGHVATWDRPNERLLVYGGTRRGETLGDLWELRVRP